jgi:hypothetical protein
MSIDRGCQYVYDPVVNSAFVASYPAVSFIISDGRGFRLATTQQLDLVHFGGSTDSNVDSSDALDALAAYARYDKRVNTVRIRGGVGVSRTTFFPAYVKLIGDFSQSLVRYLSPASSYTGGYAWVFNSTDGIHWETAYPKSPGGAENFWFTNPTNVVGLRGIQAFGGYEFTALRAYNVAPLVQRAPYPNSGGTGEYSDIFKVCRCYVDNNGLTDYAIDINGGGDGLLIDQCDFNFGSNGIRLRGGTSATYGGTISNTVGGNHLIDNSPNRAVQITNMHNERGTVTVKGGTVHIRDSIFFPQSSTTTCAIVLQDSTDTTTHVTLSNVEFLWGFVHFTNIPYDVALGAKCQLTTRNVRRVVSYGGTELISQGIRVATDDSGTTGLATWNNYAHLLSENGEIRVNRLVQLNHTFVVPNSWWGLNGTAKVPPSNSNITWSGPAATYYYKTQILYDPVNMYGYNGDGGEFSSTIGAGDIGVNAVRLTNIIPTDIGTGVVRIYRGTTTNSYDKYCDIPMRQLTNDYWWDSYSTICSLPWISRTAGAVDQVYRTEPALYRIQGNGVSANVVPITKLPGNASISLLRASHQTIIFDTPITALLTLNLPPKPVVGDRVIVHRTINATGAFNINISTSAIAIANPNTILRGLGTLRTTAEFVYIDNTVGWVQEAMVWRPTSGTTSARPTPAASEIGYLYLDTTLSTNGKPIWWNGSLWVDSTGSSV